MKRQRFSEYLDSIIEHATSLRDAANSGGERQHVAQLMLDRDVLHSVEAQLYRMDNAIKDECMK